MEFLNSEKSQKIKVNPQNLQKKSEKKINNHKKKENIQIEKENTAPAPIYNFFYFRKIENRKTENEIKIEKSEKAISMSKFNQIKTFLKKKKKKSSNSKLKTANTPRT